jgi:hypothetical protein
MKTRHSSHLRSNLIDSSPLQLALFITPLLLSCFAFPPAAAASPESTPVVTYITMEQHFKDNLHLSPDQEEKINKMLGEAKPLILQAQETFKMKDKDKRDEAGYFLKRKEIMFEFFKKVEPLLKDEQKPLLDKEREFESSLGHPKIITGSTLGGNPRSSSAPARTSTATRTPTPTPTSPNPLSERPLRRKDELNWQNADKRLFWFHDA